ncbi:uncharacterized protein F4807DRAFT_455832 [Annulohypoxylon truncatum]|uniref:uncharacterized protein n=1 Tax=Annulohypoxylon truncatum TaxID=327061 RepID=UPI002007B34A|nr:uncharacterized protein F4807DRAFT_455832 [Annulohypoxylon truncatum]KAI1214187.1 hypothetical protein F4807DRAFT_455832 [Annulohypoxylon truncatum]
MVRFATTLLAAGLFASRAIARTVCPPWQIDNFELAEVQQNNYGYKASDDGTMTNLTSHIGSISFVPHSGSTFTEEIPCTNAITLEYDYLSYTIKGPARAGSVTIELQTRHNCFKPLKPMRSTQVIDMHFDGELIERQIPFKIFEDQGANLRSITGIKWLNFQDDQGETFEWSLANIRFLCDDNIPPTQGR